MSKQILIVADSSEARFYRMDEVHHPEFRRRAKLVEIEHIFNEDFAMSDRRGTVAKQKMPHGPQRQQREKSFAKHISQRAAKVAQQNNCVGVIISAESHMLGRLRQCSGTLNKYGLQVTEYDKDLQPFAAHKIQHILDQKGLMPPSSPQRHRI